MEMGGDENVTYLAECFWPGVSKAVLEELDARVRQETAATLGGREEVSYEGSILVPEDEVVLCLFGGCSAEAVRALAERADVPFTRIVESTTIPSVGRPATSGEETSGAA
jgi:hypothetical protein